MGSSLSWYRHGPRHQNTGLSPGTFPYGTPNGEDDDALSPQSRRLRYLRQHGNYMIPGEGINLRSGIAIVLRAMLLNLLVWLPASTLVMLLLVWISTEMASWPYLEFLQGAMAWAAPPKGELPRREFLFVALLFLAGVMLIVFIVACVVYSLFTGKGQQYVAKYQGRKFLQRYGWALRFYRWALRRQDWTLHFYRWTARHYRRALRFFRWFKRRYHLRRLFEISAGWILTVMAIFVVVGSIPIVEKMLGAMGGSSQGTDVAEFGLISGPIAVLLGLGSAIWSFFKAGQSVNQWLPNSVLAPIGASLLIYGLLLTTYSAAVSLAEFSVWKWDLFIIGLLVVLAVGTGRFVNVNYIALHRFYRDRLMEAFLPNAASARDNITGPADDADPFRLSDAIDGAAPGPLYHLINTNVVLIDSPNRRRKIGGGDNFVLSALYCGSNATGWQATGKYMDNGMTLATAMAISGAAANPNTGVGGTGLTRNRAISLLMALLNLRLGYWAPHPNRCKGRWRRPNHFVPGLYEIFGMTMRQGGLREDKPFIELSDGGHFENLACYELIRRKLRLIIVCDGGADPEFGFGDLQNMLRRIKEDFGVTVSFDEDNQPDILVPRDEPGFPMGRKFAKRGHIVGTINYPDESTPPGKAHFHQDHVGARARHRDAGLRRRPQGFPRRVHGRPVLRRGPVRGLPRTRRPYRRPDDKGHESGANHRRYRSLVPAAMTSSTRADRMRPHLDDS